MHELAITQEVISVLTDEVEKRGSHFKVTRVVLEIGKLSGILPDAIRFGFEICCNGTVAQGAQLEIIEIDSLAQCQDCQSTLCPESPSAFCGCGSMNLEWLAGTELKIKEMELI